MSELKEIEWYSRSEFNKEIINVLYECGVDDDIIEERTKLLELKLKDMIMGLKQHKEIGWIGIERKDLENLFKESE